MPTELLVNIAAPVLTALFGIFGLWFQDWREDRSLETRRRQVISEANEHVCFLKEWLALGVLSSEENAVSPKAKVRGELDRIYNSVASLSLAAEQPGMTAVLTLRRALLLDLNTSRVIARILRFVYYIAIAWSLFLLGTTQLYSLRPGESRLSAVSTGIFVIAIIGILPLLVLRSLALRVGGDGSKPKPSILLPKLPDVAATGTQR